MADLIYFPTPAEMIDTKDSSIKQLAEVLESSRDSLVDISCAALTNDELDEVFRKAYNAFSAAINIFVLLEHDRNALIQEVEHYKELSNNLYNSLHSLAIFYTKNIDTIISLGGTISQEEQQIYNMFMREVNNAGKEGRINGESSPLA